MSRMPVNSLGCCAFARTPASPVMPMAMRRAQPRGRDAGLTTDARTPLEQGCTPRGELRLEEGEEKDGSGGRQGCSLRRMRVRRRQTLRVRRRSWIRTRRRAGGRAWRVSERNVSSRCGERNRSRGSGRGGRTVGGDDDGVDEPVDAEHAGHDHGDDRLHDELGAHHAHGSDADAGLRGAVGGAHAREHERGHGTHEPEKGRHPDRRRRPARPSRTGRRRPRRGRTE